MTRTKRLAVLLPLLPLLALAACGGSKSSAPTCSTGEVKADVLTLAKDWYLWRDELVAVDAERLLAQAGRLAPQDFPPAVTMGPEPFREELARAVRELGPEDRRALDGIPVQAAELPELADLTQGQPPLSPTILGLFRGPPLDETCQPDDGDPCRSIVLYRKNLCRFAHTQGELRRQIRVTLTHELGHLRGEDDDALRDRGLQ